MTFGATAGSRKEQGDHREQVEDREQLEEDLGERVGRKEYVPRAVWMTGFLRMASEREQREFHDLLVVPLARDYSGP